MAIVEAKNLFKSYGDKSAVNDLSFTVEPGEILGVIGPNGAGKSSTIRMILDFIRPDAGEIHLFGGGMKESLKNRIGYLPEEKGLYRNLSVMGLILYLSSLKGVDRATAKKKALVLLERTGLAESSDRKIKQLSKGMGQMIQLIVTILHDPELIILDEPFSGLDPVNTELLKGIVSDLKNQGKALILSTHQMNQVEEICDRVLMINHGQAVLYGELKEATERFRKKSVLLEAEGDETIGDIAGVSGVTPYRNGLELGLSEGTTPMMVLDHLRGREIIINRFEVATPSLHEIFLKLVGVDHE